MKALCFLLATTIALAGLACSSDSTGKPDPGPPAAVAMYPAYGQTSSSLILTWSVSYDQDFQSYTLLRGEASGVTEETGTPVATMEDNLAASHEDTGLAVDTTYYYRVLVTDTEGLSSISNEISASTLSDVDPESPDPVTLAPAANVTQTTCDLSWTISTADDFFSYTLLRSETPDLTEANGTVVATYNHDLNVSHQDEGLSPGTLYYYRVLVTDTQDLTALSNEVAVTTLSPVDPEAPTPVSLYPVYGQTAGSLTLTWSVNSDEDFQDYTLLRDTQPIPDENAGQVVFTSADRMAVLFPDSGLDPETDYYYRVLVTNSAGLTALSNEVIGTTLSPDDPDMPTPVLLGPVFNITHEALSLSWTQNSDADFLRYELYRADAEGVTSADTLVAEITDPQVTSFRDEGLAVYQKYFYRVWVYNQAELSIPSNEVSGVTSYDAPPAAVVLQDPTDITGTGMTLAWEQSEALDFGLYRLYRSESPVVDETTVLVYETGDQESLFFIDSDLTPNTSYYYRVYVVDTWDISSGSNVVSATTLNTEAPRCEIQRNFPWLPVGSAFAFEAVNCEDNLTPVDDLQVRWRFGDGTDWTDFSTTKTASYTYAQRGAYWVDLEVFDGTYNFVTKAPVVTSLVVSIDAGDFNMGRSVGTTPWLDMEPERLVTIDAFFIDTFEVNVAEYAAFLSDGNAGHYWPSQENIRDNLDGTYSPLPEREERPIGGVNWFNAVAFCTWAGKRLPTEAEWEYAARGPETGPNYQFPWGDSLPQSMDPVPANYLEQVGDIVDVESYPEGVTAWDPAKAIYQMAGNANEWVHDFYDPDYYEWANTNGDNTNPSGPAASPYLPPEPEYRVTRGGSWANDENPLRVSFRCRADPYQTGPTGFRCVTNVLPTP